MFRRIDWKAFGLSVLAAALAALGVRIGVPIVPPDLGQQLPPAPPPAPEPARNPIDALGRLVMSGGYCSATPITPIGTDKRQYLLSAAHCVKAVGEECQFYLRTGKSCKVRVVSINRLADCCILETEPLPEALPYLNLATETPPDGTAVFHAGFGSDNPGNREAGRVVNRDTGKGQVMFSLNVSPGDSGGGICLDSSGAVVSPVCCTTKPGAMAQVFGARPEVVRSLMASPASFVDVPPMQMPQAPFVQ